MKSTQSPLARLHYHVSGAVERGESQAIAGILCPATLYRSYFNEFLSIGRFAEYYGLSHDQALAIIEEGRALHEAGAVRAKEMQS